MTDQPNTGDDDRTGSTAAGGDGYTPPTDAEPTSVLSGFSWDDPAANRPRESPSRDSGSEWAPDAATGDPRSGGDNPPGQVPETPEQSPYGQQPTYGQQSAYGQQPTYGQQPGGEDPYTQPPSSPYAAQPYAGQPYGQGELGQTLTAEQEKVRSSAILWTILNGIVIFFCGNLLAIPGVICAGVAISRVRDNVSGARSLVKWSWILFTLGFVLGILFWVGLIALIGFSGVAGMTEFSEFNELNQTG